MKMTKRFISLLLSVLLIVTVIPFSGLVTKASALEKVDVLIWNPGDTSYSEDVNKALNDIKTAFGDLNLKESRDSLSKTSQTYDLSELGFLMVFLPNTSISSADLNVLKEFNDAGGHIMFVGEHSDYSSSYGNINGNISAAAKNLGFNISFSTNADTTPGVGVAVPINSSSPLFNNVTELAFVFACEIIQTDNATEQVFCENKACLVGKSVGNGYISVISDCNVFAYSDSGYYHSSKENITNFLMNCYYMSKIVPSEKIKPEWFEKGAYNGYNHELAQFCADLVMLGYEYNGAVVAEGLKKVGLTVQSINMKAARDEVNYFIADKSIKVNGIDKNLIVIGCIGSYKNQWYSNFDPLGYARENPYADNSEKNVNHIGFADARDYVYGKLNDYIKEKNIDKSNSIILLTGHSRGSATVNLLGAKLIDNSSSLGVSPDNIYTYGFATPNTTTKLNSDKYNSIINIVNPEDFVTKVMLRNWGYRRYGKTYTLPSKTNDKNYQYYLNKMRPVFKETTGELYDPYKKGEVKTYKMVKNFGEEVRTLEDFYSKTFWYSMSFEEPFIFKTPFTFFRNTLLEYLVSGDMSEIMDIILYCGPFYLGILTYFAWPDINSGEVIDAITSEKKMLDGVALGGKFEHAHLMDTYAAYIHSMTSEEVTGVERKGYEGTVNCPVDVEIYDKETGELVGRIVNNVVDEEIAARENAIVMDVEGDSKTFWLPSNGDYDVRLIGNDEGTMDYTLAEVDSDEGEIKRVNFFDVAIEDELTFTSDIDNTNDEFAVEEHVLVCENEEILEPTEITDEETTEEYTITVSSIGGGYVTEEKTVKSGDYVLLTVAPVEDWKFIGWYENGELISTEAEIGFVAKSDRNFDVKFEHNHSYKTEIVAPTCTEEGYSKHICRFCAYSYNDTKVEATGHKSSEWITDKKATVYKSGSKHKECTECGKIIKIGTIPQLKCATPVLKKVSNANSYVKIIWGTVKGADLYRVYRRIGTGDYEYIGSAIGTYFNDKKAPAGKICRYKIRAKNESGYSEFSESLAIKHVDEPKLKTIKNTSVGVKITWGKVTGAEKYNVYRKVSGGEYKYIGATSNTYYTDKTAKSGTKYYYAIRGKRGDNVSSQSASLYKYYLADPPLKSIDNTEFGVLIKWDKVRGREEYNVYRKVKGGSYSKIGTTKNTYYTDKKAKSGKKYYYIVKAVKGSVSSASSSAKSIYHLADPTLKIPSSTKSGVKLTWTKVTGAEGYMVYRKTGSGSYTKIKTEKGVSNLSYTDASAKKGKKYTYKIKAYKNSTCSAYSNAKAITDKY